MSFLVAVILVILAFVFAKPQLLGACFVLQGGGLLPSSEQAYVTVGQSKTVVKHPLQGNACPWVEHGAAKDAEVQMQTLGTFLLGVPDVCPSCSQM